MWSLRESQMSTHCYSELVLTPSLRDRTTVLGSSQNLFAYKACALYNKQTVEGETQHNRKTTKMAGRLSIILFHSAQWQRSIIFCPSNPIRLNIFCGTNTSMQSAIVIVVVMRHHRVKRSKSRGQGVGQWHHRYAKYASNQQGQRVRGKLGPGQQLVAWTIQKFHSQIHSFKQLCLELNFEFWNCHC